MKKPEELMSEFVDIAKKKYEECPNKNGEWDNFHQITLNVDEALKFLFAKDKDSNSGYLIDEGPSERLYHLYEDDGEILTTWCKGLFDSHKKGYRKGISNHVPIAINVEELNHISKSGELIKYYPPFTLALANYHRRRTFYDQYDFSELQQAYPDIDFIPNEPIIFSLYLWKPKNTPSIKEKEEQYQSLYDLFDSSSAVDNAKCKIQGVLNLSGLKNYLRNDYFVKGSFTSALKHLWGIWSSETYNVADAIGEFREEILWLDSLTLNNIFAKKNPHCACYFEALILASKKYGGKNQHLKRVLKSIDSTFNKVNEDPTTYWCNVFEFTLKNLVSPNRTAVLVNMNCFKAFELTGSKWLALESKGLHLFDGKDVKLTSNSLEELIALTNQKGRSYQRSAIPRQQEIYVSLILGYIHKMMNSPDIDSLMRQISTADTEYLGDIAHNESRLRGDQKYSIMKVIVDELKNPSLLA